MSKREYGVEEQPARGRLVLAEVGRGRARMDVCLLGQMQSLRKEADGRSSPKGSCTRGPIEGVG